MDIYQHPRSPFDNTAMERLHRMGLLLSDGSVDRDTMVVFSTIFAGEFYDDLCDTFTDDIAVRETLVQLFDAAESATPKQKFLLVCLQYDSIQHTLPDPVWWISGTPVLAELFADGFIARLRQLSETI